jgi:hypothetical protein
MPPVASAATITPAIAIPTTAKATAPSIPADENATTRLHITPFNPALLKVYLVPSVLPQAKNISYHHVETFPEKGFGYVELPTMEAQKLKKKLNGLTLKGSKVKIEEAKPEKRKAVSEEAEAVKENEEPPKKRVKKAKKEQGVLNGVELPDDRKVKRGWTEPAGKNKKDKRDKKEKKDKKEEKANQKDSKYTKEPEMLFKAKLTPVAATEMAQKEKKDKKEKKKDKEEKKEKKKSGSKVEVIHEFKKNKKEPSFLRSSKVSMEKKPPVEYINGTGWVDEDGNLVEAETGKARNRRVLELVDSVPVQSTTEKKTSVTPEPTPSPKNKTAQKPKLKKATPPLESSESEAEDSSVVSSSDNEDSESESDAEAAAEPSTSSLVPTTTSPARAASTPEIEVTPSSPEEEEKKEVHPLEALFKRPRPPPLTSPSTATPTSAPAKGLAPINTSFSFFENENTEPMEVDTEAGVPIDAPVTPYTQRDIEWRGLRSAAPTPDTAAIGRRFSFPWRKGSQEVDDDEGDDDTEAGEQLSNNTKANSSVLHLPGLHLPGLVEEDEDEDAAEEYDNDDDAGTGANEAPLGRTRSSSKKIAETEGEVEESEFGKWFWENRGENNRAWKKRRRETLKVKRLRDNKKITSGGRV